VIANLLDMSRVEAGALDVTLGPVSVDEVVASALANTSGPTGQITLDEADPMLGAIADSGLLERVVSNLVSNALRHAPSDGDVRIETSAVGDRAVIRVVDRGPGIPAAVRDTMFDPFQRLSDHGTTGVGLGLAVAKGFMESMAGELVLDDTPGGGLTVTLSLPVATLTAPMELEPTPERVAP